MNPRKFDKAKKIFFIYLGIDIIFNSIVGFNTFSTIGILKETQAGTRTFHQLLIDNLNFWSNVSFLAIIILIGVGISLVSWLNSCYSFARHSVGLSDFSHEKWIIMGWIIPVYNFFKPYQVISEIYKAGSPDYLKNNDWKKEKTSNLLLAWWIFWIIIHIFIGYISIEIFKKSFRDELTLDQMIFLYQIRVWFYSFSMIISISWFFVAEVLTERLMKRSSLFSEGKNNTIIKSGDSLKQLHQKENPGQIKTTVWTINEDKEDEYSDDSYFNEGINDDIAHTRDLLEKDWSVALKYYNDLSKIESRLSKISTRLSYQFQHYILREKAFDDRQKIADTMEYDFFKTHFGENQKIIDFARYLIEVGNKPAAKIISEAVRVLGNKIDPDQIVGQIKNDFSDSFKKRLVVIAVNKESEAERLGIQEGDILYSYNEIPVESNDILASLMNQYQGQQHILKIIRGQQQLEFYVTAGSLEISAKPTSDAF